jgi:hypothetical protein
MSRKPISPENLNDLLVEARQATKNFSELNHDEIDSLHSRLHNVVESMGKQHSLLSEVKTMKCRFKAVLASRKEQQNKEPVAS